MMQRSALKRLNSLPKRKAEFIDPMECALVSKLPEGPDWSYEVKLDGYRAIEVMVMLLATGAVIIPDGADQF